MEKILRKIDNNLNQISFSNSIFHFEIYSENEILTWFIANWLLKYDNFLSQAPTLFDEHVFFTYLRI